MPASVDTVKQLTTVIRRYVPPKKLPDLIADLRQVTGNQSVGLTMRALADALERS
jgi:hypothetical protein